MMKAKVVFGFFGVALGLFLVSDAHARSFCGSKTYDPVHFICCDGVINYRGNNKENTVCCATRAYNRNTSLCCKQVVVAKSSNNACCGTRAYSTALAICCRNIVYTKGSNNACCGTRPYNNSTAKCCKNKVIARQAVCR